MISQKMVKGLASVMENTRPDCYDPPKIEREIQWNHTLKQMASFIMHNNSFIGFDRDRFYEDCGGKFEHSLEASK